MSESDLVHAIAEFNSVLQGWVGLYFSGLTAYLITAFVAGTRLTSMQVTIITGCFVTFSTLSIIATYINFNRLYFYAIQLSQINRSPPPMGRTLLIDVSIFLLTAGIFVALLFMWQVRHGKLE